MNKAAIIQAKIAYLSGHQPSDLDPDMQAYVDGDAELSKELEFITAFWQVTAAGMDERPSAQLDARFYQMLEQAHVAQTASHEQQAAPVKQKAGLMARLRLNVLPTPVIQLAALGVVFGLGYGVGQPEPQASSIAALQQQVQTLSNRMALNMLAQNSASERLGGVSFGQSYLEQDPDLSAAMLALLNTDPSTSVRLAVVESLNSTARVMAIESALLESLVQQPHPLVQLALIKKLQRFGSSDISAALQNLRKSEQLSDEAIHYLQLISQQHVI
ncbi:HEAT repeat domain-containing protein [Pseudoalteromonas fenneropenaei]|uniref:HEAT repeat domain-containing protein n=1 Tax=Pseudoalteromonas fenneropenaei TaxID=1737459 RepID=A0ABV7CN87_9GAMM